MRCWNVQLPGDYTADKLNKDYRARVINDLSKEKEMIFLEMAENIMFGLPPRSTSYSYSAF